MDDASFNAQLKSAIDYAHSRGASQDDMLKLAQTMETDYKNQQMVKDSYNAYNNAKGFASQTIKNVDAFHNSTTQNYTDSLADGLIKYNPIGQGDNYNPLSQAGATAVNAVGDVGSAIKGLYSIVRHPINFLNQVANDPTLLVGPAAQQLLTGVSSSIRNRDLGDLWKGVQGAATSFTNHPVLSILPFLGAEEARGAVTDFAKNPIEALKGAGQDAAGKTMKAAEGTVNAITDPMGTLSNMYNKVKAPFAQIADRLNTSAQIEKATTEYTKQANTSIEDLTQKSQQLNSSIEDLAKADKNSPELERLNLEKEKVSDQLDAMTNARSEAINSGLAQMELLKRVSTGDVPTADMGNAMADALDQIGQTVRKGYEEVLPRNSFPSMQPIIEGLQKFSDEIAQGTNTALKKTVLDKIEQLTNKETLKQVYDEATSPEDVTRRLAQKGLIGMTDSPVSASFLKTTLQGELRDAIVRDNPSYGKVWQDTVAPKIDEAIKAGLDEGQKKAYDMLNEHYKALDGNSLAEKFRNANTEAKVLRLLKDAEVRKSFDQLHPGLTDLANQAVMRDILQKSWSDKNGAYDWAKLSKSLDENKGVINKDDYLAAKGMALNLRDIEANAGKAAEAQETVGGSPAKTFNTISKIDSMDALNKFTEASGMSPEEVGRLYVRSLAESIDPSFVSGNTFKFSKNIENDLANLKSLDDKLQKYGGSSPEAAQVREAVFGKDGLKMIDDLHNARLNLEQLAKEEGVSSTKRALKVAFGGALALMKFYWTGARLMKEGMTESGVPGENIIGNKARQSTPTPTPVKPSRGIIKKAIPLASEGANANENNNQ